MLEGVVEEMGSEVPPDDIAISTFPHSLRVWPGSGNKLGAGEVVTSASISEPI